MLLPPWFIVIVHVPGAKAFTMEPETEHTSVVDEVELKGNPDDAVALKVCVPPTVKATGCKKEMV